MNEHVKLALCFSCSPARGLSVNPGRRDGGALRAAERRAARTDRGEPTTESQEKGGINRLHVSTYSGVSRVNFITSTGKMDHLIDVKWAETATM